MKVAIAQVLNCITLNHLWWEGMNKDGLDHSKNCPQCAIVSDGGHEHKPPLHPIPAEQAYQILGVDIMEVTFDDR